MVNVFGLNTSSGKRGPPGPPGVTGPSGKVGKPGPQGDRGVKGESGETGARGASGERGPRGVAGEKGEEGLLSTVFFAKQIVEMFEKNLTFSCYFNNKKDGFIYNGDRIIGLKNRNGGNHAHLVHGDVGSLIHHIDKYALEFKNSIYKITDLDLATGSNSKAILILNFKIGVFPTHYQYILISKTAKRQLYLKGSNLILEAGGEKTSLPYQQRRWNVVYIEFSNTKDGVNVFRVNDESRNFVLKAEASMDEEILLGGYREQLLTAVVGRIAVYSNPQFVNENLPEKIRNLYLDQLFIT